MLKLNASQKYIPLLFHRTFYVCLILYNLKNSANNINECTFALQEMKEVVTRVHTVHHNVNVEVLRSGVGTLTSNTCLRKYH